MSVLYKTLFGVVFIFCSFDSTKLEKTSSSFPKDYFTKFDKTSLSEICLRQPPALPYRLQYSTIGRLGLNHRVRDGNGCVP